MKAKKTAASLLLRALALLLLASAAPTVVCADTPPGNGGTNVTQSDLDTNPGYAAFNRRMYFKRFPAAQEAGPTEMGGHDVIQDQKSMGPGTVVHSKSGPVYIWPITVPTAVSQVPTKRDESINDDMFQTFGLPVSDTQMQVIQRYNDNRMLEQAYDPEKVMWTSSAMAGMQSTSAANGAADMSTNQSQSAIDFTKKYLTNFTSQQNNRWQQIRDQLFIPMAILLLLPGAVLAQVKAIVSQGSPVLGDTNPWEGILRSIIAVFLIPATFLVINYGIDVSNSITLTIAQEYHRIFGSDMYKDAQCGQLRAFPVNPAARNDNAMIAGETPPNVQGSTAWDPYEALSLNLREYDPCAKIDKTRSPDERVRDIKKITRLMVNGANVGLTGTWNIMCAFQMAFLYYLWCMGPIAAALWVWPLGKLRGALPSWIEGTITLCFWSLFWNTVVLLMACFRGVGDSGTVLMSALNFLADICVKYAFDFSSLVSQGASQGITSAMQNAASGAGAAAGAGGQGGAGSPGAAAKPGGGTTGTNSTAAASKGTPSLASNLAHATAQNANSAVGGFTNASAIPTGHAMPPGTTGTTGATSASPTAFHPNSGTTTSDLGLPPSAHPSANAGLGTNLAGSTAPNPLTGTTGTTGSPLTSAQNALFGGSGSSSSSPMGALAAAFNPGAPGASGAGTTGGQGLAGFGQNGALGQNGMGLHMDKNGHLQAANAQALQNQQLQNQLNNPQSQLNQQLGNALQQLQNGNPQALQALASGASSDPQTQAAMNNMFERGATVNPADAAAINAFAQGQTLANGQPAVGFNDQGQLMNNLTHQPISFTPGNGTTGIDPTTGLPSAGLQGQPPNAETANLYKNGIFDAQGQPIQGMVDGKGNPVMPQGGVFDVNGQPVSQQQYAQLANYSNDFQSINNQPTIGLSGLNGQGGAPPTLLDQNGHAIPATALNPDGTFQPGFQPTGNVYAYNSSTDTPIAGYNAQTHQWSAVDPATGQPNGITMNAQGQWQGATANGGTTSALTNEQGNWYAAGTNGAVQYDTNTHNLQTSGVNGAPVTYDAASNTYRAGDNPNIAYNAQANSFVDNVNGAPVTYSGSSNNWYAQGTDGNVVLNSANNTLSIGGSSDPRAQVNYDSQTNSYSAAGGQVHYDQASHRFETANNAPVTYDNSSGNWYGANSNNNVVYDQNSRQLEVASSGTPVSYDNGTYYASGTNNQIAYDPQSNSYGVAGSNYSATNSDGTYYAAGGSVYYDRTSGQMESVVNNAPVSVDSASGQWYAAGTNNSVQYDTNTGAFYTPSQAPVTYDNGQFYAAGTNNSVFYDQQTRQWESNTSNGLTAYSYDTSSHQWAPSGGGGGEVYRVNQDAYAQAMPSSNYAFTSSNDQSAVHYGGGTTYDNGGSTNYVANSGTYFDSSSNQYVTGGSGTPTNYYNDGGTAQYANNQGNTYFDSGTGQYVSNNNQASTYYDAGTGQTVSSNNQGSTYYDASTGQTVSSNNQGTYYDSSTGQYVSNNQGYNQTYDNSGSSQYLASQATNYVDQSGYTPVNNSSGYVDQSGYTPVNNSSSYVDQSGYSPVNNSSGYFFF